MRLEFFYDIVSPWSYLAFEALVRRRADWNLELVMRPAFLGGVMKATGNAPPASLPARGVYLMHDLARGSRYFDVALGFPSEFPANTIKIMRWLTLIGQQQPALHEAAARAAWQRHWGEGHTISTIDDVKAVSDTISADPALLTRLDDDDVKAALRAATEEAVARGSFGFPSMFVRDADGDELHFFGSDRLSVLAHELGLPWDGPVPGRRLDD